MSTPHVITYTASPDNVCGSPVIGFLVVTLPKQGFSKGGLTRLPVMFSGLTVDEVTQAARAQWAADIEKERAKVERYAKLAASRRKEPAIDTDPA